MRPLRDLESHNRKYRCTSRREAQSENAEVVVVVVCKTRHSAARQIICKCRGCSDSGDGDGDGVKKLWTQAVARHQHPLSWCGEGEGSSDRDRACSYGALRTAIIEFCSLGWDAEGIGGCLDN